MSLAKLNIENATENCCYMKRRGSEIERLASWIVAKKLEAMGFKCELSWDELKIDWA